LESIRRQTRPAAEVIVVNDGGFAETTEFVSASFPEVKLINIDQSGAGKTRNTGVVWSSNEIVLLIDDDDTLLPEAAERLLTTLATFPEARAAYGDNSYTNLVTGEHRERNLVDLKDFAGRFNAIKPIRTDGNRKLFGRGLYVAMLHGNLLQQPWAVYRDSYLEVGGFGTGLVSADDWEMYLRITQRFPVAFTYDLIGHQFTEPGRPHLTTDPRQLEGQIEAGRRHLKQIPLADVASWISLRRKLGGQYKYMGDSRFADEPRERLKWYAKSLVTWPFDAVVVARSFGILPLRAIMARCAGVVKIES
jgi:glycosyltransferase involved in cell wall biosynthesis